jgi:hypothetical protein
MKPINLNSKLDHYVDMKLKSKLDSQLYHNTLASVSGKMYNKIGGRLFIILFRYQLALRSIKWNYYYCYYL